MECPYRQHKGLRRRSSRFYSRCVLSPESTHWDTLVFCCSSPCGKGTGSMLKMERSLQPNLQPFLSHWDCNHAMARLIFQLPSGTRCAGESLPPPAGAKSKNSPVKSGCPAPTVPLATEGLASKPGPGCLRHQGAVFEREAATGDSRASEGCRGSLQLRVSGEGEEPADKQAGNRHSHHPMGSGWLSQGDLWLADPVVENKPDLVWGGCLSLLRTHFYVHIRASTGTVAPRQLPLTPSVLANTMQVFRGLTRYVASG